MDKDVTVWIHDEYFASVRKDGILQSAATWVGPVGIMLSKITGGKINTRGSHQLCYVGKKGNEMKGIIKASSWPWVSELIITNQKRTCRGEWIME